MFLSPLALLQVIQTTRKNLKQTTEVNIPKNTAEVYSLLKNTSFSPIQTLATGLVITVVSAITIWLGWSIGEDTYSFSNLLIIQILVALVFFVPGLKKVPPMKHAIITVFGKRTFRDEFEDGKKSILQEGWHWLIPWICGAIVVDTRERSVKVPEAKFVVPDSTDGNGKKQNGITVNFKNAQINFRVWNPFAILDTGEDDVDNELISVAAETMRSHAHSLSGGPEEIFGSNVDQIIMDKLTRESDSERWGALIVSVKTPNIEFASSDSEKAFEALYVEKRQRQAEGEQRQTVSEIAGALIQDFPNLTDQEALLIAQRNSGLLRPSDIVITQSGRDSNDPLGLTAAAAIIAGTQQNQPKKTKGGEK